MGSSQSAEVPGGGSEGYHVLRVGFDKNRILLFIHALPQVHVNILFSRFRADLQVKSLTWKHFLIS